MTPQEAIKILKPLFEHCKGKNECLGYIEHFFTKDEEEAFDMAIKALEQPPYEDCISREDILDAIETWDKFGVNAEQKLIRWQDHYVPYVHLDDVRNAIANMPSVTPKYTDAEIQKMQELEQAQLEKAYELGKVEMQPCEDCISREILDKIKAEIDQEQYYFMATEDYDEGIRFGLMLAYQIIDKYIIESEE